MEILTHQQIKTKITRLAIEILENNYNEKEIILAGINKNGMRFAQMLLLELESRSNIQFHLSQILVNPKNPIAKEVEIDTSDEALSNKVVIVIDDVGNTGRTIFYAFKVLMNTLPKKVETAVLIDRKHKSFAVKPDYVGLSLATTSMENIRVYLEDIEKLSVHLN